MSFKIKVSSLVSTQFFLFSSYAQIHRTSSIILRTTDIYQCGYDIIFLRRWRCRLYISDCTDNLVKRVRGNDKKVEGKTKSFAVAESYAKIKSLIED